VNSESLAIKFTASFNKSSSSKISETVKLVSSVNKSANSVFPKAEFNTELIILFPA
jgi:hypothetical protein